MIPMWNRQEETSEISILLPGTVGGGQRWNTVGRRTVVDDIDCRQVTTALDGLLGHIKTNPKLSTVSRVDDL